MPFYCTLQLLKPMILKIIHFRREECKIKGGGEKIKGGGFKKGGGTFKKGGNLPPFPPLAKTLHNIENLVIYKFFQRV